MCDSGPCNQVEPVYTRGVDPTNLVGAPQDDELFEDTAKEVTRMTLTTTDPTRYCTIQPQDLKLGFRARDLAFTVLYVNFILK